MPALLPSRSAQCAVLADKKDLKTKYLTCFKTATFTATEVFYLLLPTNHNIKYQTHVKEGKATAEIWAKSPMELLTVHNLRTSTFHTRAFPCHDFNSEQPARTPFFALLLFYINRKNKNKYAIRAARGPSSCIFIHPQILLLYECSLLTICFPESVVFLEQSVLWNTWVPATWILVLGL